jgi:NAD(P)H-dependent FMN reductase
MKIVTVNGSARAGSYTGKALALFQHKLLKNKRVDLISIEATRLKLAIPGTRVDASDDKRIQEMVANADGILLATPEYHGSFSSMMKLIIENLGFPSTLKGKPVALLGVAAGRIGAIKSLEHLRSVCSHVGALVLPRTVSVARVRTVFDEEGNCLDSEVEKEIRNLAAELVKYVHEIICPKISIEEWARSGESRK